MTDQQQIKKLERVLTVILWLYVGNMLWTLLSTEIPVMPAHDVMYEISGLAFALLPVILVIPAKGDDRIERLKSLISTLDIWVKGFLLALVCVVLMSVYSLILYFLLPNAMPNSTSAAFINWLFILLKWSGIGMIFWSQLQTLRQKIFTAESDIAKRKSKIAYWLVSALLIVLIVYFVRHDLSGMIGFKMN